jgi:hypothetical protein
MTTRRTSGETTRSTARIGCFTPSVTPESRPADQGRSSAIGRARSCGSVLGELHEGLDWGCNGIEIDDLHRIRGSGQREQAVDV